MSVVTPHEGRISTPLTEETRACGRIWPTVLGYLVVAVDGFPLAGAPEMWVPDIVAPDQRRWTGIEPAGRGSPVPPALKAGEPTRCPDTSATYGSWPVRALCHVPQGQIPTSLRAAESAQSAP